MAEILDFAVKAGVPVSQIVLIGVLWYGYQEMKALRGQLQKITETLLDYVVERRNEKAALERKGGVGNKEE